MVFFTGDGDRYVSRQHRKTRRRVLNHAECFGDPAGAVTGISKIGRLPEFPATWSPAGDCGAPLSIVRPADLTELSALLADGKITPAVDRTYALGDLPAAITDPRERRACGKVVVLP